MTGESAWLPSLDGHGGVRWEIECDGRAFGIRAFVDDAYGPEAPLFELPSGRDAMAAARALDLAFGFWRDHRAEVDALLAEARATSPASERPPPSSKRLPPGTRVPARHGASAELAVTQLGPPELTNRDEILWPLLADGVPVTGSISLFDLPGLAQSVPHVGCRGTRDVGTLRAVMRFVAEYRRAHPAEIDTMLAESRRRRIAAGIPGLEAEPSRALRTSPRPVVRRVFRRPRGIVSFTVAQGGGELLVDVDSTGGITGGGSDECSVVARFVREHVDLMAMLGLNVGAW